MVKRRVLYFSIGTFAETPFALGGNIYAKNLVQRLVEDDAIELFALNVNREKNRQGTEEFFKRRGVDLHYVVPNRINRRPERADFNRAIAFLSKTLFRFPYELEAHNQPHITKAANWAVRHWGIEHLLVDYLPAAVFWKDVESLPIPKTIVTVNREADLYAEVLALGEGPHGPLAGRVSHWRLKRFERRMHRAFDQVIAIGTPDLPDDLSAGRAKAITPYLDESADRWTNRGNKTVFFAGNVAHYPNRRAIDHILSQLAPRVLARVPDAEFAIIGASTDQIPPEHQHPAIHLMGVSTPAEVKCLFTSAALFLCPVENTFGMKFKVAEAAAYGTPFLASEQTMLGFPYLQSLPHLTLSDPDRSADKIVELLVSADRLQSLSDLIVRQQRAFAASQKNVWSRTLWGSAATRL